VSYNFPHHSVRFAVSITFFSDLSAYDPLCCRICTAQTCKSWNTLAGGLVCITATGLGEDEEQNKSKLIASFSFLTVLTIIHFPHVAGSK
jgi:hypothetical protein